MYEEFARSLPGFLPNSNKVNMTSLQEALSVQCHACIKFTLGWWIYWKDRGTYIRYAYSQHETAIPCYNTLIDATYVHPSIVITLYIVSLAAVQRSVCVVVLQFIANEEFLQILMKCIQEINQHLRVALAPPNNPHIVMMRSLLEMTMQLRIIQNHINILTLLQKVCVSLTYVHAAT